MTRSTSRASGAALLALVSLLFLVPMAGHAQVPQPISYQGSLTDAAGAPVTGPIAMTFRLWDEATAGSLLWTETQASVPVTNGAFQVLLGADAGNPLTAAIFENPLYLGIAVGNDAEMTPRQALSAVGYAMRAKTVEVDTLNALSCAVGQLAKWDGAAWDCETDDDTQLSEIQVESFVTNAPIDLAAGSSVGNEAILTSVDWTIVTGVPAGFADNVDDDALGALGCPDGQVAKVSGGAWTCAADATSGLASDLACVGCVSISELDFDTATQSELAGHAGDATAHHVRYSDAEAEAAVGPHVTSVDGLAGGAITGAVTVAGTLSATGLAVDSTALVANLNSDRLDNLEASQIIEAAADEVRRPISSVPFTISAPGSYYLTGDLTLASTTANGITVNASNVTIDLMGFSLIGPGSGTGDGIHMEARTNVEIRNGTVRDFGRCGILELRSSAKAHRVIDLRLLSNGSHGSYLHGNGHSVEDCTAVENGHQGIWVYNYATVVGNITSSNGAGGIYSGRGAMVAGNASSNNVGRGIETGFGSTVTGNTVYSNSGEGIFAVVAATVSENVSSANAGHGIAAGGGSRVIGNLVYDSGGNGIATGQGCGISDNTVRNNDHNGIIAGSASKVVGNTANRNNLADLIGQAGIRANDSTLVKDNTATANLQNNIYVANADNAVEENLVTNSTNGINFALGGNFYANNRASGNKDNYLNGAAQTDGGGNVSF